MDTNGTYLGPISAKTKACVRSNFSRSPPSSLLRRSTSPADNAAPCLLGGLTALVAHEPPEVVAVPVPTGLWCVLVHPHVEIETRRARQALPASVPLDVHVEQSSRLAGFLAGCFRNDGDLVVRSLVDLVAGPARAPLIPAFERASEAARAAGAAGLAIAGSGPSLFAFLTDVRTAQVVERAVRESFVDAGIGADGWVGAVRAQGAFVETIR